MVKGWKNYIIKEDENVFDYIGDGFGGGGRTHRSARTGKDIG